MTTGGTAGPECMVWQGTVTQYQSADCLSAQQRVPATQTALQAWTTQPLAGNQCPVQQERPVQAISRLNTLFKYADDTTLVVPEHTDVSIHDCLLYTSPSPRD